MRRFFLSFLGVIACLLLNTSAIPAPTPPPINETINVDFVDLYLTASDKKGFITDLRKEEISVAEDGIPQAISTFSSFAGENQEIPLSLAFMIDNSGSMVEEVEGVWKIDLARDAGLMLIGELATLDRMMVISFDETPKFTTLSSNRSDTTQELHNVRVRFGGTALFDAMLSTIDHLNQERGRKILVVCSDGNDNLSKHKIDEVIQKMVNSPELTVVIMGTVASEVRSIPYDKVSVSSKGRENLQKMADSTGGYAFFPKSLKEATRVQQLIRSFVRSQYTLSYRSSNRNLDGSWRNINITCRRKGVTLNYRKGYYAR
jgi:Ca-activated chloride channel homolog